MYHYFIKFTTKLQLNVIENIKFETVGPRSISKQELIEKFNAVLN